MPSSLNVVALISGGKDSLYSVLHCLHNGHNVVALANVHPSQAAGPDGPAQVGDRGDGDGDDLNSFMYQTVGHSVVPLYASALKLPLYRRAISGTASQTGRYYVYTPTGLLDETEDLVPLLHEVMQHHPEINAICSGAILSTYQRTRIESVAIRLGLTPLAFLWQYPALPPPLEREDSVTGLLDDMAASGCDSRIIKAASGGVTDSMLWADVASPRTRNQLVAAMSAFFEDRELGLRGSVLGEGGEYETLAVNGPSRLWKQRIVVDESANDTIRDEGGASHLRLGKARLVEQEQTDGDDESNLVRIPGLYDPAFAVLQDNDSSVPLSSVPAAGHTMAGREPLGHSLNQADFVGPGVPSLPMSMTVTSTLIAISNITTTECCGAAHKTRHLMQLLQTCIQSINRQRPTASPVSVDDIVFSVILLESMADFAAVNEEYGKLFRAPNPPARVTVACGDNLPDAVQVSISVVFDTGLRTRRAGLHVQSRSYWAPANIGPYSQAISVALSSGRAGSDGGTGEVVHMAGQIPLVPHTMQLLDGTFSQQTILSLQHLWRVGQEREVDLWTHGVAFLGRQSKSVDANSGRLWSVWRTWREAHAGTQKKADAERDVDDGEAGPDAWDLRYNPYHHRGLHGPDSRRPSGSHLHPLPRLSVMQHSSRTAATTSSTFAPPIHIAEVDSLPKSAPIEWHSLGLARMPTNQPRVQFRTTETRCALASYWTVLASTDEPENLTSAGAPEAKLFGSSKINSTDVQLVTLQVYHPEELAVGSTPSPNSSMPSILSTLSNLVNSNISTIAHGTAYVAGPSGWSILQSLQQTLDWDCLTTIPCHALWGAATEHGDRVKQLSLGLVLRLEGV